MYRRQKKKQKKLVISITIKVIIFGRHKHALHTKMVGSKEFFDYLNVHMSEIFHIDKSACEHIAREIIFDM